jgi:hypothetical protein
MKAHIQRHGADAVRTSSEDMIHRALLTITPADLLGWLRKDWGEFWEEV